MAVGSAYGIHFITHYKDDAQNRTLTPEEHRALVFELMRKIIKPVFLAALTTFVGFSSFCFTTVLPIREFGIFASFGVFSSFAVAVTLIPSLLLVRGPSQPKTGNGSAAINSNSGSNDPLSDAMADGFLAVARKKRFVMFCTILLIAAASIGMSRLVVDNVLVEYFKHDTDVNKSDRFIREKFGGSKELTLVVEADSAEDLLNPTVLGAVDGLNRHLTERLPIIGSATGFTDFVKRMNQVFNADESPSGLRPTGMNPATRSDSGNGSNDELGGFGNLGGFGDFSFNEDMPVNFDADEYASESSRSNSLEQYSAADLIALLDSAAGSQIGRAHV
jgi:predicted RND superfamily exporter protein